MLLICEEILRTNGNRLLSRTGNIKRIQYRAPKMLIRKFYLPSNGIRGSQTKLIYDEILLSIET